MVEKDHQGLTALVTRRKEAQKLAVQKALLDAFQKLCIVVLESGKIAVEYRPREETGDAWSEEELQGLIQVGRFAWEQHSLGKKISGISTWRRRRSGSWSRTSP